jgi:hypothetical protein
MGGRAEGQLIWDTKGWKNKNFSRKLFVFVISQLIQHQNLKILVPTLHNTQVIICVRDKNFQVSMLYEMRNCKNKKDAKNVFAFPPFRCFFLHGLGNWTHKENIIHT